LKIDVGGGEGRGDYAEIEPWAPDLNHFYWSTLTIKRKEGGDYEEIEPWAPNLNHFYWSTLTIGGGLEQRRLGIGCRSMLRGRQGVGGEE